MTDTITITQFPLPFHLSPHAGKWYVTCWDELAKQVVYLHQDLEWRTSMTHPEHVFHYCRSKQEAANRVRLWRQKDATT